MRTRIERTSARVVSTFAGAILRETRDAERGACAREPGQSEHLSDRSTDRPTARRLARCAGHGRRPRRSLLERVYAPRASHLRSPRDGRALPGRRTVLEERDAAIVVAYRGGEIVCVYATYGAAETISFIRRRRSQFPLIIEYRAGRWTNSRGYRFNFSDDLARKISSRSTAPNRSDVGHYRGGENGIERARAQERQKSQSRDDPKKTIANVEKHIIREPLSVGQWNECEEFQQFDDSS